MLLVGWLTQIDSDSVQLWGPYYWNLINYLSGGVDGDDRVFAHHGALPFQVVQGPLLVGGAQP